MAGNVAPIAAVAGNSNENVPAKATSHCQTGVGSAPIAFSNHALDRGIAPIKNRLHSAITSSHPAYQRTGRGLASMRDPKASTPTPMPPKNAATTASTAAASCPNHEALCCVHTIW